MGQLRSIIGQFFAQADRRFSLNFWSIHGQRLVGWPILNWIVYTNASRNKENIRRIDQKSTESN